MIDLHCHVLPGIDDGPADLDGSLALARGAAESGIRTIVATPHVSWRYPNTAETIAMLVEDVNRRLSEEGVPVEVLAGAEIAMTRIGELDAAEIDRLALGDTSWLLVEPPFAPAATGLEGIVLGLRQDAHRVLLAHPERCPAFHRDPAMLERIVAEGVLTSITAGSLVGRFGAQAQSFALDLLEQGLVHNVASDAHDVAGRPPSIAAEIEQAGLGSLCDWLARAVPTAILAGGEIPPRPATGRLDLSRPRRRWWRVRR